MYLIMTEYSYMIKIKMYSKFQNFWECYSISVVAQNVEISSHSFACDYDDGVKVL